MKKVMLLASENPCDILRDTLDNTYITLPCYNPDTAEKVLSLEPEVLILNLSLPGWDSLTFLKNNASVLPPVVIALTVFFSDTLLSDLADLGISAVIRIPCHPHHLKQQLSELLTKKHPSR